MPIGEIIGEALIQIILELILYPLAYYTGAMSLWILTLGQIRLAPLSSMDTTNRGKKRWMDWSIWLHKGTQGRALKAECVCLVGVIVWITVGVGIFFALR